MINLHDVLSSEFQTLVTQILRYIITVKGQLRFIAREKVLALSREASGTTKEHRAYSKHYFAAGTFKDFLVFEIGCCLLDEDWSCLFPFAVSIIGIKGIVA